MKKRQKAQKEQINKISKLNKWIRMMKQGEFKPNDSSAQKARKNPKSGAGDEYMHEFNAKKNLIEKNLKNLEKEINDKTKEGLLLEMPKFKIKNKYVMQKDRTKK